MFFKNKVKVGKYRIEIPKDMAWCFDGDEYYESNVICWLRKVVKCLDMPVLYDVGANYGYYSISLCGSSKHVYAFEPVSNTYRVLQRNIEKNKIKTISALKLGISNEERDVDINLYSSSGNNSLFKRKLPEGHSLRHVGTETIKVTSLDKLLEAEDLLPPDIIKIDVEGAEFFVLQGATKTISEYKPVIFLEFAETTSSDAGYSAVSILNELLSHDYVVYGLTENVNDTMLYPLDQFGEIAVANIIALSKERHIYANFLRLAHDS